MVSDAGAAGTDLVSTLLEQVDTWPRAMVACTLILAVVILRRQKQTKAVASDTQQDVRQIKTTLTTNNGGSHVKDVLERIESRLEEGLGEMRKDLGGLRADHRHLAHRFDDHLDTKRKTDQ